LAGFFLLSTFLSHLTGLTANELSEKAHNWVLGIILVIVLGLIALPVLLFIIYIFLNVTVKFRLANRMERRIAAGDHAGAIRLGESVPADKQDLLTKFNLAFAYAHSGQTEKAKAILQLLEQTKEVPKYCTEELKKQFLDNLRNAIVQAEKTKLIDLLLAILVLIFMDVFPFSQAEWQKVANASFAIET
jgi:hypothetical protein